MKKTKKDRAKTMRSVLALFVSMDVLLSAVISTGIALILIHHPPAFIERLGAINELFYLPYLIAFLVLLITLFAGALLSIAVARFLLRPIDQILMAMEEVTKGNFEVRTDVHGTREWQELSDYFNRMTQELASVELLRNEFISEFSHELKTPLSSVLGFSQLLQNDNLTSEQKTEYLEAIVSESKRLVGLSENILALTRYETTTMVTDKTSYALDEQIRRCVLLLQEKWIAKDIEMNLELDAVMYTGDADLIQQIWKNLIDNAIKFTPPGGSVSLRLREDTQSILFSITDTGIGMDATAQAHVFDKFYRADSSRTTPGNGLGLSIVYRVVLLCGGTITLESVPEQGSTFTVRLPQA